MGKKFISLSVLSEDMETPAARELTEDEAAALEYLEWVVIDEIVSFAMSDELSEIERAILFRKAFIKVVRTKAQKSLFPLKDDVYVNEKLKKHKTIHGLQSERHLPAVSEAEREARQNNPLPSKKTIRIRETTYERNGKTVKRKGYQYERVRKLSKKDKLLSATQAQKRAAAELGWPEPITQADFSKMCDCFELPSAVPVISESFDYEDKLHNEIAAELGITPNDVSQKIYGQKRTMDDGTKTVHGGYQKKLAKFIEGNAILETSLIAIYELISEGLPAKELKELLRVREGYVENINKIKLL